MNDVYLITGGAGFVGSALVRQVLQQTAVRAVVLDALTYAGHRENLEDLPEDRLRLIHGDICDRESVARLVQAEAVTHILHLAAESHVDRSILGALPFVQTNVLGTQTLLDVAREQKTIRCFLHVSTDEVYGSLSPDDPPFAEELTLDPNSPYAASKASSDLLALAAQRTHGLPVIVTRCSNNYGPRQMPEKLIPLMTLNALEGRRLPIYGDGMQVRDWIHVDDHARGLLLALERGKPGRVYNLGGECEKPNRWIVQQILEATGASEELIEYVRDRPAHDRRYAMDIRRARAELGFAPQVAFEHGLRETVAWYRSNPGWCDRVRGESYAHHQARWYVEREAKGG